jgi:hypothetical protein
LGGQSSCRHGHGSIAHDPRAARSSHDPPRRLMHSSRASAKLSDTAGPADAHSGHGVRKEHRPAAREGHLKALLEGGRLHVCHGKAQVANPRPLRLSARGLDEAWRGIDAQNPTLWAHRPRDAERRVTEAAADVKHALAGARRHQPQGLLDMHAQPGCEQMAKASEAVIQRAIQASIASALAPAVCASSLGVASVCHRVCPDQRSSAVRRRLAGRAGPLVFRMPRHLGERAV